VNNIDLPCAVSVVYVYETSKIYSFVALCFVFKSLKEKTYHCISNFVFFILHSLVSYFAINSYTSLPKIVLSHRAQQPIRMFRLFKLLCLQIEVKQSYFSI